MISTYQIYGAYNVFHEFTKLRSRIVYSGETNPNHKITWSAEHWLKNIGFDWPMTEEQEVEFKLRFL